MAQPEVTIEQGTLRGSIGKDIKGSAFYKFQGIPYAKPPLGELRFKAPVPPEKWSGILDATKEGNSCRQRDPFKNFELFGSEDCLVLNIFTKKLPENDKDLRPVLFFIHGGGFIWGSANEEWYGPDNLITEDVVLVTINYRLGLLGFINFEDSSLDVTGNAGLKDQIEALKWVQKNINKFGGDPNNVTIFGESAGGASVHLLVLSPMGKGLFHKAIAQSGCALNPWARGTKGSGLIAKVMGLEGADDKTIYDVLVKKSLDEISEIQDKLGEIMNGNLFRLFSAVVENGSKQPFLDKEPIDIILSGTYNQVPFMLGYTTCEGMCFEIVKPPNATDELSFENPVPWFLGYEKGSSKHEAVSQTIRQFYFGNENYSPKTIGKMMDLFSDSQIVYGIHVTTLTHLKTSNAPIYLYRMSIDTQLNYFKRLLKTDLPGVSHGDDLGYLFKQPITPEIKPGSIEDISRMRFVKLWSNFAIFGKPTPNINDQLLKADWRPVISPDFDFLDIGTELVLRKNPDTERMCFWKNLYAESPVGQKSECGYLKTN